MWQTMIIVLAVVGLGFVPDLDNGLVAHYRFNECDARDDTGNGSDGRLFGDPGCWCGIEGDGLLFDGHDDHLLFDGKVNAFFATSDFTVSFYIKPEGKGPFRQSLLSKRLNCNMEHMFDFQLDPAAGEFAIDLAQSEFFRYKTLHPPLMDATWMHITLVREGQEVRTYINGRLHETVRKCQGVDLGNRTPLQFANSPCLGIEGLRRFRGVLDELRVYDRALHDREVLRLYKLHPVEHARMDCLS